ncbi:MAG: VWA domain-containing protein [Chloroflexi bacterium]|nr:VWA domain-containing protein [Chloroflexota bacterium]
MAEPATYYDILGVSRDATDDQIRRAYRQHVKAVHPDTSDRADATKQFQALQEAYETLNDARRRALYDAALPDQARPAARLGLRVLTSAAALPAIPEPQSLCVLVEIQSAANLPARPPINLCFVLDHSLSMDGERLQHAQQAAIYVIDQLSPEDTVSVVAFSDRAHVVIDGDRSATRSLARERVRAIHASGGTELLHGLKAGLAQVQQWRDARTADHIILLTDGNTYGDEAGCLEAATLAAGEKIGLTLFGLGTEWNDTLLEEMASRSGGYCTLVSSPAKLPEIFQQRFADLTGMVARDVQLTVNAHASVKIQSIFRLTPDIARCAPTDTMVRLGPLDSTRPIRVMIETLVAAEAAHAPALRALRLRITSDAVGAARARGERDQVDADVSVQVTTEAVVPAVPHEIEELMARLALFKVQEKAIADAERGDAVRATARLKSLATHLMNFGEVELARAALLEAGELSRNGRLSAEGRMRIRFGTRGLTHSIPPDPPDPQQP